MIPVRETHEGISFAVRVQPRARKNQITGISGEGEAAALKLPVAARPVDGRANEAVIEFFAELLDLARSRVQIIAGERSRAKVVRIAGCSERELVAAVGDGLAGT